MKKIRLLIGGLLLVIAGSMHAQVSVQIGVTPAWGPAESVGVRYYYLPDIEAYYDVNNSTYIYMSGGRWIHSHNLPRAYSNYDLYSGYKVTLNDYHGERPYDNYREHRKNYPRGYNHGHEQKTYGERPRRDEHHDEGNHGEHHDEGNHGHDGNDDHRDH